MSLPLNKEFTVAAFYVSVDKLTKEQAQQQLKELFLAHVQQQESFKALLAHKWGL